MFERFMSPSHYTTYNGFHALVCGMSCPVLLCTRPIGFCRAGSYRGAGVGCEEGDYAQALAERIEDADTFEIPAYLNDAIKAVAK